MVRHLSGVRDPRRQWGNLKHLLIDILVIGMCTILCDGEDFVDMEEYGNDKTEWLQGFLALPHGIPDSDTFRRVFEVVNPKELANCLRSWLDGERTRRQVCLDGKTVCGSGNSEHVALHVVTAWAEEARLSLGELAVDEKSNEITAIPKLLDLIDVEGEVVSIDAMGCQTDIADKIRNRKADYLLAVKGNQGHLFEDIAAYFDDCDDLPHEKWRGKLEKGHGRIERRSVMTAPADWLDDRAKWHDIQTVICSIGTRITDDVEVTTKRYYISSLRAPPEKFAEQIRNHWSIENHLHWALDVTFREDQSRAKKDNSPLNLNVLRKFALPILHACKVGRLSAQKKRKKAARNPDFLNQLLFSQK